MSRHKSEAEGDMRTWVLKSYLIVWGAVVFLSMTTLAQQPTPKDEYQPTQDQVSISKRMQELLRHPTFIALRLVSRPRDVPREASTDTPAPYIVNDLIRFDLFITQNSTEKIIMWVPAADCYECRPELMKDGEIISYSKTRQNQIDSDESGRSLSNSSGSIIIFKPGREFGPQSIDLDSWYDPLTPGRYQLTARKQFVRGGDWVVSNPVYFEVIPRRLGSPIPEGVFIELTPEGAQPKTDGKPYQLGTEVVVTLLVSNKSDQPLKINVIDREYGSRPQLFKDGALVPYRKEMSALIKSKEEKPRLIEIVSDFFLDPRIGAWPQRLELKKWYGPLSPGSYRLVVQHRFEIDGPWSKASAELLFEIVPRQ